MLRDDLPQLHALAAPRGRGRRVEIFAMIGDHRGEWRAQNVREKVSERPRTENGGRRA